MAKNTLNGIVVKGVGGVFDVMNDQDKFVCFSPKKLRYNQQDILVGDRVVFERLHGNKGNIVDIVPRVNRMIRPEVANVDVCFVVLAPEPQPDFYLADKVIVNCFHQHIQPIIVINKTDLASDLNTRVKQNYAYSCDIAETSAENGDVQQLLPYIQGKVCFFAGQSAVGKTSLLNALSPALGEKIGGLSQKSGRGTHTTRHASLHAVNGGYLVDTCGFSLCDIAEDIGSNELRLYIDEFVSLSSDCKYSSCTHTVEPDCAVKDAVNGGRICKERYQRYLEEYNELVQAEKNKY